MKIRKMTADFGTLDGKSLALSDGLNILYAPNETGKSTWCAFIRAMLYGIDTSQRAKAGQQPDKVKYDPWNGKPMAGSMDVTAPCGDVTIRRWTKRADQPMQAFSATVTGTDIPVDGLTSDTIGETLTGVTQAVFERSAFIRKSGLSVSQDPELDKRIGAIVSSGEEDVSYLETQKTLQTWLRRREGKNGVPAVDGEIEKTQQELDKVRQASETVAEMEDEIVLLQGQLTEAETHMTQARAAQRKEVLSQMSAARQRLQQVEDARQEAAAAVEAANAALDGTPYGRMGVEEASRRSEKDKSTAAELLRMARRLPPVKLAIIPIALAALAFLLAIFLPWKTQCAGLGCVCILLFVMTYMRLLNIRKTKEDTLADRDRILRAYGVEDPAEIDDLLERYRVLWKEQERAAFRLEDADAALERAQEEQKVADDRMVNDLDFVHGDNEAARAGRRVEEIKAQIASVKERRAAAEGQARATGDPMILQTELMAQQERRAQMASEAEEIRLALDILKQVDVELQSQFSPALAAKAAELLSRMTGGRYDEITLARDLTARARAEGDTIGREVDFLSAGAQDQLYLSLRLAICFLALPGDDPCPIILDDALVTFDDVRMAAAMDLLQELAQERQILLFTCHRREYAYFEEDPSVHCISLQETEAREEQ